MKVLQVVEQAFRTLTEEQDDTILWLTRSMRSAGAELSVLLAGHAASYALLTQRQPALQLGDWQQREPAEPARDIAGLLEQDVAVFVLREDLAERGLAELPVQTGVRVIGRKQLPQLYEQADQIWQW